MQVPSAPDLPAISLEAVLAVALSVVIAIAAALLAGRLARRVLRHMDGEHGPSATVAHATVKAVRRIAFLLALLVLVFPALELAGVPLGVGLHASDVGLWLGQNGLRILLLLLLAFGTNQFAASVIHRAEAEIAQGDDAGSLERRKRFQTLGATFRRFLAVLIWSAAALMVLRELGVDTTPVLTGAGIVGLAIGFGAQTLVKDIISGFFIIAENQARVGDVVQINGVAGTIEEINLRTIVLRDLEGIVHVIASGEIRTLANRTKDFSFYIIDVGVGYDDDTDRIVEAVRETAAAMQADPAWAAYILAPIDVLGVDAFKASEVSVRFRIKTVPHQQWAVGRELRRRIKKTFDAKGIRIPFSQMDVHVRQAP